MCKEGINLNITIESNCFQWCPRVLDFFCCRTPASRDPERSSQLERRIDKIVERRMPQQLTLDHVPGVDLQSRQITARQEPEEEQERFFSMDGGPTPPNSLVN